MSDVSLFVAFGGGLISFLSPCVLPIVPGYLGLISGLSVEEVQAGRRENLGRMLGTSLLFVLGFSVVFILLGLAATSVGSSLREHQSEITRVFGVLMVLMALYLAGSQVLRTPGLYREARFHPRFSGMGPYTAPVAGAAFGFGWTPCIGPVLGSILGVAGSSGDAAEGALLLAVYSAGLGVPFVAAGVAFSRLSGPLSWVKRHGLGVTMMSAAVLGAFGVLLILDRMWWVTAKLQQALDAVGLERLISLG